MADAICVGGGQIFSATGREGPPDYSDHTLSWNTGSPGEWGDDNWHNILVYPVTNEDVSANGNAPKINNGQQLRQKTAYADSAIDSPDEDVNSDVTLKRLYVAVNLAYVVLEGTVGLVGFTDGFAHARCRIQTHDGTTGWSTILNEVNLAAGNVAGSFMPSSNLTVYGGPRTDQLTQSSIPAAYAAPMLSLYTNLDGPYTVSFSRMMFHPPIPSGGIALTTTGSHRRFRLQMGTITNNINFEYDCWAKFEG